MKLAILTLAALLSGCSSLSPVLSGLGLPGMGGEARILWSRSCEATLVQPMGNGLASTQRLRDADEWCPKPVIAAAPAASAVKP